MTYTPVAAGAAAVSGGGSTIVIASDGAGGDGQDAYPLNGLPGIAGAAGAVGAAGPAGEPGDDGAAGAQGFAGPAGLPGAAGARGNDGDDGEAGPAGLQGPVGLAGAQGALGLMGPAGQDGEDVWPAAALGPQGLVWNHSTDFIDDNNFSKILDWSQWSSLGGAVYTIGGTAAHPGNMRVDSNVTLNAYAGAYPQQSLLILPAKYMLLSMWVQPGNDGLGADMWVGFGDVITGSSLPANGIFFQYNKATSANWICKSIKAGAATITTSTVPVTFTADQHARLDIEGLGDGTTFNFRIAGAVVATHSAGIPVVAVHPMVYCKNGIAATYTFIDVDRCFLGIKNIYQ